MGDLILYLRDFLIRNSKYLFVIILAAYAYFYFNYPPYDIDTGWFAEPAYTWLHGGPMAMPSWPGVNGMDQYTYWFPPMIFWLQIILYSIIGFGMFQDNVLLLSIFVLTAYITQYLARKIYGEKTSHITLALIVSNFFYMAFALVSNRPDALVGMWNLLAFLSYLKGAKDKRFFVLAGIFAGLSLSSHMVGSIMLPALAMICLMENRWHLDKNILNVWLLLFAGFLIGILPETLYASENQGLFVQQRWWNTRGDIITSILSENERVFTFFLHKSMPFISILFISSIFYAWKKRKDDPFMRQFLLIILFNAFVFAFVSHKSPRYYASVIPFWTILSAKMLADLFESKRFARLASLFFILTLVFGAGNYFASSMIMYHTNNYNSLDKYISEKYLGNETERIFIAQPAFFFIFKENMWAYNLFLHRELLYNESFDKVYASLDSKPKYLFFDSHMDLYNSSAYDQHFWKFTSQNTTLLETVCFVGNKRVSDENKYLSRRSHSYPELLRLFIFGDEDNCLDPARIYRIVSRGW